MINLEIMRYLKISLLSLACLLCSCKVSPDVDKGQEKTFQSFALMYTRLRSVSLYEQDRNGEKAIQLFGNPLRDPASGLDIRYNEYVYPDIYMKLCEKHDDLTYDHTVIVFPWDDYWSHQSFSADDFISVNITSDSDYDEQHPAGASLADIVRFVSLSSYQFIRNGYIAYDWSSSNIKDLYTDLYGVTIRSDNKTTSGPGGFYPLNKLLSELQPDDLKVFGPGVKEGWEDKGMLLAYLFFEHPPTLSKTHTFTVTMTTDDGKVFEDTITVTFE